MPPTTPSQELVQEIYKSSSFSARRQICLDAIRHDFEKALKPIADELKGHPLQTDKIREIFADTAVAHRLHWAIWPIGGPEAIRPFLERVLKPIDNSLVEIGCGPAVAAAKKLRLLYESP